MQMRRRRRTLRAEWMSSDRNCMTLELASRWSREQACTEHSKMALSAALCRKADGLLCRKRANKRNRSSTCKTFAEPTIDADDTLQDNF